MHTALPYFSEAPPSAAQCSCQQCPSLREGLDQNQSSPFHDQHVYSQDSLLRSAAQVAVSYVTVAQEQFNNYVCQASRQVCWVYRRYAILCNYVSLRSIVIACLNWRHIYITYLHMYVYILTYDARIQASPGKKKPQDFGGNWTHYHVLYNYILLELGRLRELVLMSIIDLP